MRYGLKTLAFSGAVLGLSVSIASADPLGSVTSTKGAVLVMRGNSVHAVAPGDPILKGDRVLARTGSSATFSSGSTLGSDMSILAKGDLSSGSFTSKVGGSSQSKGSNDSNFSGLFSKKSSGDRQNAGYDWDKDRDRDSDKDRDNDRGHHDDYPWKGKPHNYDPCSD